MGSSETNEKNVRLYELWMTILHGVHASYQKCCKGPNNLQTATRSKLFLWDYCSLRLRRRRRKSTSVHISIYLHVRTNTYACIYIYIDIYSYIYTFINICLYIYICVCKHYICIYIYVSDNQHYRLNMSFHIVSTQY